VGLSDVDMVLLLLWLLWLLLWLLDGSAVVVGVVMDMLEALEAVDRFR
jgi:hypothetical protein